MRFRGTWPLSGVMAWNSPPSESMTRPTGDILGPAPGTPLGEGRVDVRWSAAALGETLAREHCHLARSGPNGGQPQVTETDHPRVVDAGSGPVT